jgi:phosphatidylinositol 4-kinase
MTTAQTTLLMATYDLEEARTLQYQPSVILQYFCNESVNSSTLLPSLEAIANKVRLKRHRRVQYLIVYIDPVSVPEANEQTGGCAYPPG